MQTLYNCGLRLRGMKGHKPASYLSTRGVKFLIALPLLLAAFALMLQVRP